jgi:hypothetical protein
MMYGKDYAYAASRLVETIVRYKGKPVLVCALSAADGMATVKTFDDLTYIEAHLDTLDVSTPPLGMVKLGDQCVYLSRVPMRRDWRQGLRRNNCMAIWGSGGFTGHVDNRHIARAIVVNHLSLQEVMVRCKETGGTRPFHRHWAISYDGGDFNLYYKWFGCVGAITEGGVVKFDERYELLAESLEEVLA